MSDWRENPEKVQRFRCSLLAWYRANRRDLPWRRDPTPYRVWVAEIMLQQTRVDTVRRYYERFLERFPDVKALAEADLQEVLALWQGLGYYRRARHLHEAARAVMRDHHGRLPPSPEALRRLPGFGDYTVRAVASMAFGMRLGVVDGNVRRVFSRIFRLERPRPALLRRLADALVAPEDPGAFNQGLMELGSRVCRPRRPECSACPIREYCTGCLTGTAAAYPLPGPRSRLGREEYWVGLWQYGSAWWLGRNPEGLLADMWLFPMWSKRTHPDVIRLLQPVLRGCPRPYEVQIRRLAAVSHAFSHRTWILYPLWIRWPADLDPPQLGRILDRDYAVSGWMPEGRLGDLPIPAAHRKLLALVRDERFRQRPLAAAEAVSPERLFD